MDFDFNQFDLSKCFKKIKANPVSIFKLLNQLLDIKYYDFIQELIYLNREMIFFTEHLLKKSKEHKYFFEYYVDNYEKINEYYFFNRWFINNFTFDILNYQYVIQQNKYISLFPTCEITMKNLKKQILLPYAPVMSQEKFKTFLEYHNFTTEEIYQFIIELLKTGDKFTSVLYCFKYMPKTNLNLLLHHRDKKGNNILHKITYAWFQHKLSGYKNYFKILTFVNNINQSLMRTTNKRNMSPVYYIFEPKKNVLELFLKYMYKNLCEIPFVDDNGNSLLHYVKYKKQIITLQKYYDLTQFNLINENGQNPLHLLANKKISHIDKLSTIALLIDLNIDYKLKDKNGITPIDNFGKAIIKKLNL